jgi:hypothetical protein
MRHNLHWHFDGNARFAPRDARGFPAHAQLLFDTAWRQVREMAARSDFGSGPAKSVEIAPPAPLVSLPSWCSAIRVIQ